MSFSFSMTSQRFYTYPSHSLFAFYTRCHFLLEKNIYIYMISIRNNIFFIITRDNVTILCYDLIFVKCCIINFQLENEMILIIRSNILDNIKIKKIFYISLSFPSPLTHTCVLFTSFGRKKN